MSLIHVMKMQLEQSIGIKAKLESILDLVIEILLEVKDFSVFHEITFGEAFLFALTFFRAIWYVCFGVSNGNFDYYFSELTWTSIFVICGLAHLGSFFLRPVWIRSAIVMVYAFIWAFLGFLAALSRTPAPAVPTFAAFTIGSVYLAVRLYCENRKSND